MSRRTLLLNCPPIHLALLLGAMVAVFGWFLFELAAGPEQSRRIQAEEVDRAESASLAEPAFRDDQLEFFEKRVRPLLVEHCHACHGGENEDATRGGLRLDSRAGLLVGGDTGPSIVPGDPGESLLIDAVQYGDLYQMPPKSKLRDADIEVLTRWVEMGAPWTPGESGLGTDDPGSRFDIEARRRDHWAWHLPARPELPTVRRQSWIQDPLDHFVLEKLEDRGIEPAEPASPRTLIRRLYFDLIGLPPSPEEVEAFVANPSPEAYARLVDRLLESPHFGERWARHWLDLVRYAESRGHEFDYDVPNAYEYRDYVIRAFNSDVPYDQWMIEHVAGDLLESPRRHPREGYNESILGTGFWFLGEWVHSPVDIRLDECERFDNMLDVFSKTFLGLTVACARCHDHKFDAIPQSDYYALSGFLQSSGYRQVPFDSLENHREIAGQLDQMEQQSRQALGKALAASRREATGQLASYLLAAREGLGEASLVSDPDRDVNAAAEEKRLADARQALARVAEKHQLEPERVEHWARHLLQAGGDSSDPFSLWGESALGQAGGDREHVAAAVARWCRQQTRPIHEAAESSLDELSDQDIILDYRAGRLGGVAEGDGAESRVWLSDGSAFGLGPREAGVLQLSVGEDPAARFRPHGAARRDPFWSSLGLADQVAAESGRLGSWQRAGQIFRTPSFLVRHGPVHYLVRGSGVAYAAVNSHILIAGPLHGRLVMELKHPDDGQLRWVTHDLSRYRDHRTHIEFHPLDDQPLEIVAVVQSPRVPELPESRSAAAIVPWLTTLDENATWADVAARYQLGFARLLEEIDSGQIGQMAETDGSTLASVAGGDPFAAGEPGLPDDEPGLRDAESLEGLPRLVDRVALANWWLEHADLFLAPESEELVGGPRQAYLAAREELAKSVRWHSRTAPAMWEGTGMDERLMIRGNHRTLGDPVPRRFLVAIAGEDQPPIRSGSGREQLARWLVDPANPFPSRVMVNRIWHHLTGRGIVGSTDNFGVLGEEPTHPELLDHLATGFIDDGWSMKRMIRRVVLSSTYQMSSNPRPEWDRLDPEAIWLHRMRIRRLEGESIRDTLLSLSGRLDSTLYGPSVPVYLTEFMQGRGRPETSGPLDGQGRRSLYIAVRRNFLPPMMLAFDTPQPFSCVGRRNSSNVPAQALILMNDPLVTELARQWAERILAEEPESVEAAVQQMYWEAFARPADSMEVAAAVDFLSPVEAEDAEDAGDAGDAGEPGESPNQVTLARLDPGWAEYAHVLMNVKELIFLE